MPASVFTAGDTEVNEADPMPLLMEPGLAEWTDDP